ncbi:MAG: hypothetical protein DRI70_02080 [Bacteroidetes bacterium]|nr:MAG: hypothetical protein DRI70_02080 [Bacteroidota bacterium]
MLSEQSLAVDEALQDAYKTLAACYLKPSMQTLAEALQDFEKRLLPLGPEVASQAGALAQTFSQSGHQELLVDFARLFVGPFEVLAPPFGSYYIDKQLMMGDSTIALRDFYEQAGLEISPEFNNLPDHVSAVLEFLYFLMFNEIVAFKEQKEKSVSTFRDLRTDFLNNYIGIWADAFTKNIEDNAQSSFYSQLAKITKLVLNSHNITKQ